MPSCCIRRPAHVTTVWIKKTPKAQGLLADGFAFPREMDVRAAGEPVWAAAEQIPGEIVEATQRYRADLLDGASE